MLNPRRGRHPLHSAFRTLDASDYTDVATVDVDNRCVLDLCVDRTDALLGGNRLPVHSSDVDTGCQSFSLSPFQ